MLSCLSLLGTPFWSLQNGSVLHSGRLPGMENGYAGRALRPRDFVAALPGTFFCEVEFLTSDSSSRQEAFIREDGFGSRLPLPWELMTHRHESSFFRVSGIRPTNTSTISVLLLQKQR